MLIFLGDNIPVVYSIDISKATAWEHGSGVLLRMGKLNKGNWTLDFKINRQGKLDLSVRLQLENHTNQDKLEEQCLLLDCQLCWFSHLS